MNNLAIKLDRDPVVQDIGTITAKSRAAFVVSAAGRDIEAMRASSCLLEPVVGDRVLVAGSRREGFYVLAILTREDGASSTVGLEGDLEIRLPSGRFVVAAQEGVDVVSPGGMSVVAGRVNVNAVDGNVVLTRLTYVGDCVRGEIERIKLFAKGLDSVVERVTQKVKRSYRTVEESDQLRAERIDYAAAKTMSLHAENALVTAKELVKVDGDQIHMG